ncbi:MAG: hypothetical protein UU82_C0026G0001, partial [Candidatus Nomurabacteria bacterium GW2011_GWC2_41_8]
MKKYKNTLFYFFGAPFLIVAGLLMFAPSAQAAVISMQPTEMISAGQKAKASSSNIPIIEFAISATNGIDSISSVTVTIVDAGATGVASGNLANIKIFKDEGDGLFGAGDVEAGSQSTVNIGAPTTIGSLTNPGNLFGESPANPPSLYFITVATSATWSDATTADAIAVSMAADGVVSSGSSPVFTSLTGVNSLTADTTVPSDPVAGNYRFAQNAPGTSDLIMVNPGVSVGTTGNTARIYAADGTTLLGSGVLGGSPVQFEAVNVGNNTNASVKIQFVDPAGNTSAQVAVTGNDIVAPTATATAYTDRIIIQFSEQVDGMMAMNCSNYTVGGVALTCGGMGLPFVDFQGDKATIKGLSLSGTTSLVISSSNTITDINGLNRLVAYSSGSLTVNALVLPVIASIANNVGGASSGAVGDTLTITGTNFGTDPGGSHTDSNHKVFFSGGFDSMTGPVPPIEATSFTSWSATSIVVDVPTGAQGGPVNVLVSGVMSDMNQSSFFDIAGNYTAKVWYDTAKTSAMPDNYAANIRIAVSGMRGQLVYSTDGSSGNTMTYDSGTDTFTITGVIGYFLG